jgi:ATP-dependent Clp protease ATP-binding subunit ClpA
MFERFTDRARRVVVAAQDEARLLGHNHIGSEHLLLGLLDVQGGVAVLVLESAGITAEAARVQVEEITGSENKSPRGHIPFTPRAKKILELSLREALEQHKSYIGTEHILLAVIRDSDGVGAQVLQRLGGSLSALRQRVLETDLSATPEAAAEAESSPQAPSWVWPLNAGVGREARLQSEAIGFRAALASFDQRLANIERHLEITIEEPVAGGLGGMVASVGRRLTTIERHLGVTEAPRTDPERDTDTDTAPGAGTDTPEADAE